jgi:predicted nucleotidyltransferase component of viral defense system
MTSIESIAAFFPPELRTGAAHRKHILKEFLQLQILEWLSNQPAARKLAFIGGTSLRLIKGIDRFSEDLDFDCKNLSDGEFSALGTDVARMLERNGYPVEIKTGGSAKRMAMRVSLLFPGLLRQTGLSGHREERFLIKLEAQDQGVAYDKASVIVKGCGFVFPFPVPPDAVLCSMKLCALLSRGKGRDFYDAIFLLSQTKPDYGFLAARAGIKTPAALRSALLKTLGTTDLAAKSRDFEHLLFHSENARRILHFQAFVDGLAL